MPVHRITRRGMLAGSVALGAAAAVASCSGKGGGSGSGAPIVATFWGNPAIQKAFQQALDAVTADDASLTFDAQYLSFEDYFKKLAVRVAAGNPPDLIEMQASNLADYGARKVLLPLDDLADTLKTSELSDASLSQCRLDGKQVAVPIGANSQMTMVDNTFCDKFEVAAPDASWTWDSFAEWATELSKAAGDGKFGSEDLGAGTYVFKVWLRQKGKEFYAADSPAPGFSADDLGEYWNYWDQLRKAGGAASAEAMAAQGGAAGGLGQSMMMTGKAATRFGYTNNYGSAVTLTKDKLTMLTFPGDGDPAKAGAYLQSGTSLCIAAGTKDPERVAKAIINILTLPAAAKAIGQSNGVPAYPSAQKLVGEGATGAPKEIIDLIAKIAESFPAPPALPPKGSATAEAVLPRIYSEVSFGRTTIADGAKACVAEVTKTLSEA